MRLAALLFLCALAACSDTAAPQADYLRNPQTGEIAICGLGRGSQALPAGTDGCSQTFRQQGYLDLRTR